MRRVGKDDSYRSSIRNLCLIDLPFFFPKLVINVYCSVFD